MEQGGALCASGRLLTIFDHLTPRLTDSNSKVNVLALQSLPQMVPSLRDGLPSVASTRVPALATSLASSNAQVRAITPGVRDALVAGVGTGGTITGATRYLKGKNPDFKAFAVEPIHSAVISGEGPGKHRIQGIGAGFIPGNLDESLVDGVVKVEDEDAFTWARRLAMEEGIMAGGKRPFYLRVTPVLTEPCASPTRPSFWPPASSLPPAPSRPRCPASPVLTSTKWNGP